MSSTRGAEQRGGLPQGEVRVSEAELNGRGGERHAAQVEGRRVCGPTGVRVSATDIVSRWRTVQRRTCTR